MKHLVISEVKRFHESCNLADKTIIAYNLDFAVRFATLLAKADSFIKDCAEIIE